MAHAPLTVFVLLSNNWFSGPWLRMELLWFLRSAHLLPEAGIAMTGLTASVSSKNIIGTIYIYIYIYKSSLGGPLAHILKILVENIYKSGLGVSWLRFLRF